MKLNRTLLAVGLFSALPVMTFGQSTNADQTASASKAQIQPSHPVAEYKLEPKSGATNRTDKITQFGKESSQAWPTIVSQQPNPTAVHDASTHDPRFYLCSFGCEPWR